MVRDPIAKVVEASHSSPELVRIALGDVDERFRTYRSWHDRLTVLAEPILRVLHINDSLRGEQLMRVVVPIPRQSALKMRPGNS